MTGVYSWRESRGQARGFFTKAKQPAALKGLASFLVLIDPAQDFSPLCEDQILAKRAAGLACFMSNYFSKIALQHRFHRVDAARR